MVRILLGLVIACMSSACVGAGHEPQEPAAATKPDYCSAVVQPEESTRQSREIGSTDQQDIVLRGKVLFSNSTVPSNDTVEVRLWETYGGCMGYRLGKHTVPTWLDQSAVDQEGQFALSIPHEVDPVWVDVKSAFLYLPEECLKVAAGTSYIELAPVLGARLTIRVHPPQGMNELQLAVTGDLRPARLHASVERRVPGFPGIESKTRYATLNLEHCFVFEGLPDGSSVHMTGDMTPYKRADLVVSSLKAGEDRFADLYLEP